MRKVYKIIDIMPTTYYLLIMYYILASTTLGQNFVGIFASLLPLT